VGPLAHQILDVPKQIALGELAAAVADLTEGMRDAIERLSRIEAVARVARKRRHRREFGVSLSTRRHDNNPSGTTVLSTRRVVTGVAAKGPL
jgi:hypothetical protein